MNSIKKGIYKHYKGKEYELLHIAKHSETLEDYAIYKALYKSDDFPEGKIWARPLKIFLEEVEVNGKKVKRFELLNSD